jgi:hypothetical protein
MVLSGKKRRPERRKNQEEKRIAFHFGLDAKIVSWDGTK